MTVNISTDLTNAHYVDSARNLNSSVATSSVSFTSGVKTPNVPDGGKTGISTPQQLQDIQNDRFDDYELLNNINMAGFDWTPLFTGAVPFAGTFDGRNFTISNLTIDANAAALTGFFGAVLSVTIENVVLVDILISNLDRTKTPVGGLIGQSNTSIITNCFVSGTINGDDQTGSFGSVGGIVGQDNDSTYTRCGSTVNIRSIGFALVVCGGFVGDAFGTYIDCYYNGTINSTSITFPNNNLANTGGFAGRVSVNVIMTNCYSAGILIGDINTGVGGFIGVESGSATYSNCFWDGTIETFGLDDIGNTGDVANITEKTTDQMQSQATFTDWDFDTVWEVVEGVAYPTHQWANTALNPPPGQFITTTFTQGISVEGGLDHLEGEAVSILADGTVKAQQTVTNGAITEPGGTTHIGLPYKAILKPMKPDKATGRIQRIIKVFLKLFKAQGGTLGDGINQDTIEYDGIAAFTGRIEIPFTGGYDRKGETQIEHSDPTPITVISEFLEMTVD